MAKKLKGGTSGGRLKQSNVREFARGGSSVLKKRKGKASRSRKRLFQASPSPSPYPILEPTPIEPKMPGDAADQPCDSETDPDCDETPDDPGYTNDCAGCGSGWGNGQQCSNQCNCTPSPNGPGCCKCMMGLPYDWNGPHHCLADTPGQGAEGSGSQNENCHCPSCNSFCNWLGTFDGHLGEDEGYWCVTAHPGIHCCGANGQVSTSNYPPGHTYDD